jgi:ribonuclease Z
MPHFWIGKVVNPSDCIGPETPGPISIIVDCPTEEYLMPLVTHPIWARYLPSPSNPSSPAVVIHMTPFGVLSSEPYRQWVHAFGPSTQHIFINKELCAKRLVFRSAGISVEKNTHME